MDGLVLKLMTSLTHKAHVAKVFFFCCLVTLICGRTPAFSEPLSGFKTSAPIMQNPFDLASGGASLTRASLDGILFVNPSLAPLGPGFFRWIFMRNALHLGAEPRSILSKTIKNRRLAPGDVDAISNSNLHIGADLSAGVVTSIFSGVGFSTLRTDFQGGGLDSLGLPTIQGTVASYSGIYTGASFAFRDLVSVAFTGKGLYGAEAGVTADAAAVANSSQFFATARESLSRGSGFGTDVSTTFQKRTQFLDVRLALVANDVTTTPIKNLPTWLPSYSSGLGLTFHSRSNALHCAYDMRDLNNAYDEPAVNKIYYGCKALFENFVAVGAGMGQGLPAYGALINTLFLRLEAGMYGRKLGTPFGIRTRKVYYLGFGFHIP